MAFEDEAEALETFGKIMPKGCVFLVDTYDSVEGVKRAIAVAKRLQPTGFQLEGVRLDSGDLARLSIEIRKILDREGFHKTEIMASNELDEYLIRDLKQQGAKISIWGVGTHLVTARDQPALDGIYKLSAIQDKKGEWVRKLKLSEQTAKVTNPGILQIRRFFDGRFYLGDAIYDELLGIKDPCASIDIYDPNQQISFPPSASHEDLLIPIFRKGKLVADFPSLPEIRDFAKRELSRLPPPMERFSNPQPYHGGLEKTLYQKKLEMIKKLRGGK